LQEEKADDVGDVQDFFQKLANCQGYPSEKEKSDVLGNTQNDRQWGGGEKKKKKKNTKKKKKKK